MSETKMTKSDKFAAIEAVLRDAGEVELADFCVAEIDALAAKAAKAKERAAAKKVEADELEAAVASALTDELQTGNAIFDAVDAGDEDFATLGKVRSRLNKLVKSGTAVKDEIKVEVDGKTKTVMGYRLA